MADYGDVVSSGSTFSRRVSTVGGTPTAGQKSLTTTVAAVLHADLSCRGLSVQNDPSNTVNVLIGDSSNQYFVLVPGAALSLDVSNANLVYAKNASSTTQSVNWIAVA